MILDSFRTDHQYIRDFLICFVFVAVHPEYRLAENTHLIESIVYVFKQFRRVEIQFRLILL